jgi:secondary thiamine-phosphate synthase enzyme
VETIGIKTSSRAEVVDITRRVQEVVSNSGTTSGLAVVCTAHTTAGLTINENADPDVQSDLLQGLARLAPQSGPYAHNEGNADAHIKMTLAGQSVSVPVEGGELQLGTWQGIYFCEFDGPRQRRVMVQVLASK